MENKTIELKGLRGLRELANGKIAKPEKKQKYVDETVTQMSIATIQPGKFQPRRNFDDASLRELANSINKQGIIQPIIVRMLSKSHCEIIAGERRWRAAQLLSLDTVPVIVKNIDDCTAAAFALIENLQREDLNPIEEALSFTRLQDEFNLTHAQIAEMVGRSRSSVTNTLRLLSLEKPVKDLIEKGLLEMGHARALLTLQSGKQTEIAITVVEKSMSTRQAEQLVRSLKNNALSQPVISPQISKKFNYWRNSFFDVWSNKVDLRVNQKGKGRVVFHVDSEEELERLVKQMRDGFK